MQGFATQVPAGTYTATLRPGWDEARETAIPYTLTLRADPPEITQDAVTPDLEHADMSTNVAGDFESTLDVATIPFHVSADAANTHNYLILEQGTGCVSYRILKDGNQIARGTCDNNVIYYPQEGDYQLQATGLAGHDYSYYLYYADQIPDGLKWWGGGGNGG